MPNIFSRGTSMDRVSLTRGPAPEGVDPKQWDANPYASFDYRHTGWQKFLEGIGFRTNFDQYRESMANNAKEYDAQLAEKAHNEEYDSPAAQAARYRAAGINPDINGDVSAGSSSPVEPDPNGPIAPEDSSNAVSQVANTIMGVVTTAIGLGKDALSLKQMSQAVDANQIGNVSNLFDTAFDAATKFIPAQYPEGDPDWVNRSVGLVNDIVSPYMSRKQLRSFRNSLSAFYNSAPKTAKDWESWYKNVEGRKAWFNATSSNTYSDEDDVMRIIADNIMKMSDKVFRSGLSNQVRSVENEATYLENIDPQAQAEVENMTNRRNIESSNIDYILNETISSILSDLRDHSESNKRGHTFASVALLAFSLFRMINISRSQTRGQTPNGPIDVGHTSIGF